MNATERRKVTPEELRTILADLAGAWASTGRAPHFFASDASALADIKACAVAQSSPPAEVSP